MAPSLDNVQAVGSNGIPLELGSLEPLLYIPDGYDLVDLAEVKGDFGSRSKEGIIIELRFLAYNDLGPYQFSVSCNHTRNHLISIEEVWAKGTPTSALKTAFWDACYGRHHHPRCFLAREAYLGLVAEEEVTRWMTASTEKMEKASRTAKAEMIGMESILEKTTEELKNLGFDRSVEELLDAEIEHAYQTVPDLKDAAMSTEGADQSTTRKRPPPWARIPQGKRASLTAFIPAGGLKPLDRVILADRTNYFPRPCTNTARRKEIARKRELSLANRMARLTHAQQDMVHAAFSKEISLDSIQMNLQRLTVVEKETTPTYLGRIIQEIEDQEEVICFKGRQNM